MKIVLVSESPFRGRALDLIGLPYETRPSGIMGTALPPSRPIVLIREQGVEV